MPLLGSTNQAFALTAPSTFQGMLINADVMEREEKIVELKGNVQIIFNKQHLTADKAIIYQEKKHFIAEGNVLFITPKATIGGDKIEMNYENNIGTIHRGYIHSGQVFFEGDLIEKTGEDTYYSIRGQYTGCTTCPPAWSFKGSTIEAQLEGYAIIKNSILQFGVVPVLWLPYLVVPLKSTRQTGLLTPNLDYSDKGGLAISQPFFWAISPSDDATFTLKNYARRGLKTLVNYRFQMNAESSGEFNFATIEDQIFTHDDRLKKFRSASANPHFRRWYMKYKHYLVLPNDWIHRMDFNNASDLQYSTDFPRESLNQGDPAMESRISLTKNTKLHHFAIDNSYYINMLKSNPVSENNEGVHRLPEIHLASKKINLYETGFLFDYDILYNNFFRNGFAYDDLSSGNQGDALVRYVSNTCDPIINPSWEKDPKCLIERDGLYNSGIDLIRSGQRLIFEPTISRPIKMGEFFDLVPKVSYRESHYSFGISDMPDLSRRFLRAEIRALTLFSKVYGNLENPLSTRYKHEIQPEIITTTVPWIDQPNHPFLGFTNSTDSPFYKRETISDKDLYGDRGIQFDYNDNLYDRHLVTYRLTNKIMRKQWEGNSSNYDQIALWRLSQTYDAYEARRENGQPWSDIESILNVRLSHFNTYTKLNFLPYQKVTNTSSRVSINDDRGNFFQTGLTRTFLVAANGSVDVNQRTEDYEFLLGTSAKYINFIGKTIYDGNSKTAEARGGRIKSWTYAFIIKPPGNCWGIYFIQDQIVNGEKNYSLNFEFLFDGQSSTKIGKDTLEEFGVK
jgi:LPS-assembly protein